MPKLSELKDLAKLLQKGKYSILSAANPAGKLLSAEENAIRMAALEKKLADKGYQFERTLGKYGAEEPSVIVTHPGAKGEKELENLAKEFGQESIYHSQDGLNKLKYLSGEKAGSEQIGRGLALDPNAKDMYTQLGDVKFSGNIDEAMLPSRVDTAGKSLEELAAQEKVLEQAGVPLHDKRFQFIRQAMSRKLPAVAGAAGGAALLSAGSEAEAAPLPAEKMPEQPGMIGRALETLDKYTGRPTRAAASAALSGENPLMAAKESITQDKDVAGQEVAQKLLNKLEGPSGAIPLRSPGQEEFPAEKPLGIAADMALDPTNVVPLGKFGKLRGLLGR